MLRLFKIGTKWPGDPYRGWRDGQLVEIYPSETPISPHMRKHFLVVEDGLDYWDVRGSTDWKSTNAAPLEFKKLMSASDAIGKFPWEFGFDEKSILAKRDYFIDPKRLFDDKLISSSLFDRIYNKSQETETVVLYSDPDNWLKHEKNDTRLDSKYSLQLGTIAQNGTGSGTGGGFTIGAAGDYATVTAFEADLAATLTGNLDGLHLDEETAIGTIVTFDLDTATYLLKLTAEVGAEHDGSAYGNGARINMGTSDRIAVNEITDGDLDDMTISNLAIDGSGSGNLVLYGQDGGNDGAILFDRCLLKGDSNSSSPIRLDAGCVNATVRNCIIYDFSSAYFRIGVTCDVFNNTIIGCDYNFRRLAGTVTLTNNIAQAGVTADFNGAFTSSRNISEDATSPDVAYRSKDLHTNSVFKNYGADDYRLDSGGDATNLAIVDDGDNLYSSGVTEDIEGQARDNGTPFWIGASHISAAPPTGAIMSQLQKNNLGADLYNGTII